jgi:cytochrome c nitrite reductase small subunit
MQDTNGTGQPENGKKGFLKRIFSCLPDKLVLPMCVIGGLIVGLGAYCLYASNVVSYLDDDPKACVNCHIMASYYQSWSRSSHAVGVTCNDCHVPQHNALSKYLFKAKDGLYHAAVFTVRAEAQAIRPTDSSYEVILENCVRCHTQLNTEFVKTGMVKYADVKKGRQQACWDCHRDVPHKMISNLASAPDAAIPFPASPVPQWLKAIME